VAKKAAAATGKKKKAAGRRRAQSGEVVNAPLQTFLIELAADDGLRERFSKASEDEQRVMLACGFRIGNETIAALLSGKPGRVKARLRFSDQQGTPHRRRL
jgi:hypothetical protein